MEIEEKLGLTAGEGWGRVGGGVAEAIYVFSNIAVGEWRAPYLTLHYLRSSTPSPFHTRTARRGGELFYSIKSLFILLKWKLQWTENWSQPKIKVWVKWDIAITHYKKIQAKIMINNELAATILQCNRLIILIPKNMPCVFKILNYQPAVMGNTAVLLKRAGTVWAGPMKYLLRIKLK